MLVYDKSLISPQLFVHISTTKQGQSKAVKPGSFHSKEYRLTVLKVRLTQGLFCYRSAALLARVVLEKV